MMWKILATGLWIIMISLGSFAAYFSGWFAPEDVVEPVDHHFISTDTISVPLIGETGIDGYILGEFVFSASDRAFANETFPVVSRVTDSLIGFLQSDGRQVLMPNFELPDFKRQIVARLNSEIRSDAFHQAYVSRLDFVSKEDMERQRDRSPKRLRPVKIVPEEMLDRPPPKP